MPQKTTIVLSKEMHERVRRAAAESRKSMGSFIREAIKEKLETVQPKPRAIGVFSSGHQDTAESAGDWRWEPRTWRS
jgi:hypothetical protein